MSMTINEAAVVDEGAFSVRRTIHIEAAPEKVWLAVTEPEHISRWFGQTSLAGSVVGSAGTITWPGRDGVPVRIEELEPDALPRRVSYRWSNPCVGEPVPASIDDHSTVFTFTLEPEGAGTRLTVVETGFQATTDPSAHLESHRQGWNGELDKLVALLEGVA